MVSIVGSLQIDTSDVTKGSYIACMYNDEVWFGIVQDVSEEFSCILVLELGGLIFLEKDDTCWIRESDILCTIEHPS